MLKGEGRGNLRIYELKEKIKFVREVGEAYCKRNDDVVKIDYEVFANKKYEGDIREYLRVDFSSGDYSIRNCNGNSLSAILYEISKLVEGGYYDENEYYEKMKEDGKYGYLIMSV